LLEKGTDQLVGVVFRAERFDLTHDPLEGGLYVRDGALRKVTALLLQATLVLHELFSVELGDWVLRADRPRRGHEAWHAGPQQEL
jgi:hypothetical protein